MFSAIIEAPFGKVGIRTDAGAVREIVYLPEAELLVTPDSALAQRAAEQITAYFERPGAPFDLPLAAAGTLFQRRVWQAICAISLGTVQTYGQLAQALHSAPRAVGQACGANPFPLVIPCHRVISSSGLGGFSNHAGEGYYRDVKRWLLAHEGIPHA